MLIGYNSYLTVVEFYPKVRNTYASSNLSISPQNDLAVDVPLNTNKQTRRQTCRYHVLYICLQLHLHHVHIVGFLISRLFHLFDFSPVPPQRRSKGRILCVLV